MEKKYGCVFDRWKNYRLNSQRSPFVSHESFAFHICSKFTIFLFEMQNNPLKIYRMLDIWWCDRGILKVQLFYFSSFFENSPTSSRYFHLVPRCALDFAATFYLDLLNFRFSQKTVEFLKVALVIGEWTRGYAFILNRIMTSPPILVVFLDRLRLKCAINTITLLI